MKNLLSILIFIILSLAFSETINTIPIHRFYHKSDKDHFYSKDRKQKKTWKHQGIEFWAFPDSVEGTIPIHRFYHKSDKDHFYTKDRKQKKTWKHQGIEFWAFPDSVEGTIPIHRFYHKSDKDHFYTKDRKQKKTWKHQGVEFWAFKEQFILLEKKGDLDKKEEILAEQPALVEEVVEQPILIEEVDSLAYHISNMYGCHDRDPKDKVFEKFKKSPFDYNESCGANDCHRSSCLAECHWNECFLLPKKSCGPIGQYNISPKGLIACIFKNNILDKHDFLLSFEDNLQKVNSTSYYTLKTEIDKMLKNFTDDLQLDSLFTIKYSEKEIVNQYFDEDGYLNALLSLHNPSEYEAQTLKNLYYVSEYIVSHYEKNRFIKFNKSLEKYKPEWSDIVEYLGGYSELAKSGVTKKNASSLFNIEFILSSIELIDGNNCRALVEIRGNNDFGLKFHNIVETELLYNGTYDIDEFIFSDIYHLINYPKHFKSQLPAIHFSFSDSKYISDKNISVPLHKILPEVISLAEPIEETMRMMVNDLVSNSEYKRIDPLYAQMHDRLINYGFDEKELNKMTLSKAYKTLYDYMAKQKRIDECMEIADEKKNRISDYCYSNKLDDKWEKNTCSSIFKYYDNNNEPVWHKDLMDQ